MAPIDINELKPTYIIGRQDSCKVLIYTCFWTGHVKFWKFMLRASSWLERDFSPHGACKDWSILEIGFAELTPDQAVDRVELLSTYYRSSPWLSPIIVLASSWSTDVASIIDIYDYSTSVTSSLAVSGVDAVHIDLTTSRFIFICMETSVNSPFSQESSTLNLRDGSGDIIALTYIDLVQNIPACFMMELKLKPAVWVNLCLQISRARRYFKSCRNWITPLISFPQ